MKKSTRKQVCQISNTSSSMNRICTCTENRDSNPVYENSFKILMITYSHSLNSFLIYIYRERERENTGENRIFFVRSPHHKYFGKAQHLVLRALW